MTTRSIGSFFVVTKDKKTGKVKLVKVVHLRSRPALYAAKRKTKVVRGERA
jgi:hypothetical protein